MMEGPRLRRVKAVRLKDVGHGTAERPDWAQLRGDHKAGDLVRPGDRSKVDEIQV